jgi:hypothetical protein
MWFICKCFMVFALFYVFWRADMTTQAPPPAKPTAAGRAARPPHPAAAEDPLAQLQRAALEKLAGAAREKCLAQPRDCFALLKSANEATGSIKINPR